MCLLFLTNVKILGESEMKCNKKVNSNRCICIGVAWFLV